MDYLQKAKELIKKYEKMKYENTYSFNIPVTILMTQHSIGINFAFDTIIKLNKFITKQHDDNFELILKDKKAIKIIMDNIDTMDDIQYKFSENQLNKKYFFKNYNFKNKKLLILYFTKKIALK